MLKVQRAAGLLLVAAGAAVEAAHLAGLAPLDAAIGAHAAAALGAAFYALTKTGGKAEALLALVPVPVLAPVGAVLLAWNRGNLPRAARAPRRPVGFREGLALTLGLAAVGAGAAGHPTARFMLGEPEPPWETVSYGIRLVDYPVFHMMFDRGSRTISPEAEAVLHQAVAAFVESPDKTLVLRGFKPSFEPYDTGMAVDRAQAVRDRLVYLYGINASRIQTEDFFESDRNMAGAVGISIE